MKKIQPICSGSTGFSNYCNRQKYKYIAGIIGFNDSLYNKYYNQLMKNIISYDEGEIEYKTLQLPNIDKFNSKDVYFINIKTKSSSEITSFNYLKNKNKSEILSFTSFPNHFQHSFLSVYKEFLNKNFIIHTYQQYYTHKNKFRQNNLHLRCLQDTYLIKQLNHDQSSNNKILLKKENFYDV